MLTSVTNTVQLIIIVVGNLSMFLLLEHVQSSYSFHHAAISRRHSRHSVFNLLHSFCCRRRQAALRSNTEALS